MNSELVRGFADTRSVAPSTYHMRRDDSGVVVFGFAKPEDAEVFRERFGGERVWGQGCLRLPAGLPPQTKGAT